jgi:exosortase/archaeosortase family protein
MLGSESGSGRRETHQGLIIAASLIFLMLPFTTTFNELLTSFIMKVQLYTFIESYVAPVVARMTAAILHYVFGLQAGASGELLAIQAGGRSIDAYIIWNCIGWQSLILYGITIITGLRGSYTRVSKVVCTVIGLQGTILLNIMRLVLVVLVALFWGSMPAGIFHDYAGTLLTLVWLVAFWELSYTHILQPTTATSN